LNSSLLVTEAFRVIAPELFSVSVWLLAAPAPMV